MVGGIWKLTLPWLFLYGTPWIALCCRWISTIHLNHILERSVSLRWLDKEPKKTNYLCLNTHKSVSALCLWLTPWMGNFCFLSKEVNTKLGRVRERTVLEDKVALSGCCEVPLVQVWSILLFCETSMETSSQTSWRTKPVALRDWAHRDFRLNLLSQR